MRPAERTQVVVGRRHRQTALDGRPAGHTRQRSDRAHGAGAVVGHDVAGGWRCLWTRGHRDGLRRCQGAHRLSGGGHSQARPCRRGGEVHLERVQALVGPQRLQDEHSAPLRHDLPRRIGAGHVGLGVHHAVGVQQELEEARRVRHVNDQFVPQHGSRRLQQVRHLGGRMVPGGQLQGEQRAQPLQSRSAVVHGAHSGGRDPLCGSGLLVDGDLQAPFEHKLGHEEHRRAAREDLVGHQHAVRVALHEEHVI